MSDKMTMTLLLLCKTCKPTDVQHLRSLSAVLPAYLHHYSLLKYSKPYASVRLFSTKMILIAEIRGWFLAVTRSIGGLMLLCVHVCKSHENVEQLGIRAQHLLLLNSVTYWYVSTR